MTCLSQIFGKEIQQSGIHPTPICLRLELELLALLQHVGLLKTDTFHMIKNIWLSLNQ